MCERAVEDERPGSGGEDIVRYEVQLDERSGADTRFWKENRIQRVPLKFELMYSALRGGIHFLFFLSETIGRWSRPVVGKA
jgi:hypothetical protein